MNPFRDILQHGSFLYVPRMADHDHVLDSKKAPGTDGSDLKCIDFRRLGLFQRSHGSAANGSSTPRSPGCASECATHKHEIPSVPPNLPVKIVAIEIRDGLPAGTEGFSLHPDRIGNERIGLHQNTPNFQMARHLVNLHGLAGLNRLERHS